MLKLLIDTATQALVIGVMEDDKVLASLFDSSHRNHSERLIRKIDDVLQEAGKTIKDVDEFIVGSGPGSYTGVRIGVTVGKMFAYTLNKPLYESSTLALIASSYMGEAKYLIPIIDARRQSVFATIYNCHDGILKQLIEEKRYSLQELIEIINDKELDEILFVGLDTQVYQSFFDEHTIPYHLNIKDKIDFKRLFTHSLIQKVENVHAFVPHYRRLTQAEYELKEKENE